MVFRGRRTMLLPYGLQSWLQWVSRAIILEGPNSIPKFISVYCTELIEFRESLTSMDTKDVIRMYQEIREANYVRDWKAHRGLLNRADDHYDDHMPHGEPASYFNPLQRLNEIDAITSDLALQTLLSQQSDLPHLSPIYTTDYDGQLGLTQGDVEENARPESLTYVKITTLGGGFVEIGQAAPILTAPPENDTVIPMERKPETIVVRCDRCPSTGASSMCRLTRTPCDSSEEEEECDDEDILSTKMVHDEVRALSETVETEKYKELDQTMATQTSLKLSAQMPQLSASEIPTESTLVTVCPACLDENAVEPTPGDLIGSVEETQRPELIEALSKLPSSTTEALSAAISGRREVDASEMGSSQVAGMAAETSILTRDPPESLAILSTVDQCSQDSSEPTLPKSLSPSDLKPSPASSPTSSCFDIPDKALPDNSEKPTTVSSVKKDSREENVGMTAETTERHTSPTVSPQTSLLLASGLPTESPLVTVSPACLDENAVEPTPGDLIGSVEETQRPELMEALSKLPSSTTEALPAVISGRCEVDVSEMGSSQVAGMAEEPSERQTCPTGSPQITIVSEFSESLKTSTHIPTEVPLESPEAISSAYIGSDITEADSSATGKVEVPPTRAPVKLPSTEESVRAPAETPKSSPTPDMYPEIVIQSEATKMAFENSAQCCVERAIIHSLEEYKKESSEDISKISPADTLPVDSSQTIFSCDALSLAADQITTVTEKCSGTELTGEVPSSPTSSLPGQAINIERKLVNDLSSRKVSSEKITERTAETIEEQWSARVSPQTSLESGIFTSPPAAALSAKSSRTRVPCGPVIPRRPQSSPPEMSIKTQRVSVASKFSGTTIPRKTETQETQTSPRVSPQETVTLDYADISLTEKARAPQLTDLAPAEDETTLSPRALVERLGQTPTDYRTVGDLSPRSSVTRVLAAPASPTGSRSPPPERWSKTHRVFSARISSEEKLAGLSPKSSFIRVPSLTVSAEQLTPQPFRAAHRMPSIRIPKDETWLKTRETQTSVTRLIDTSTQVSGTRLCSRDEVSSHSMAMQAHRTHEVFPFCHMVRPACCLYGHASTDVQTRPDVQRHACCRCSGANSDVWAFSNQAWNLEHMANQTQLPFYGPACVRNVGLGTERSPQSSQPPSQNVPGGQQLPPLVHVPPTPGQSFLPQIQPPTISSVQSELRTSESSIPNYLLLRDGPQMRIVHLDTLSSPSGSSLQITDGKGQKVYPPARIYIINADATEEEERQEGTAPDYRYLC